MGVFYVLHLLWQGIKRKKLRNLLYIEIEIRLVLLHTATIYLFKMTLIPRRCYIKIFLFFLVQTSLPSRISYCICSSSYSDHCTFSLGETSVNSAKSRVVTKQKKPISELASFSIPHLQDSTSISVPSLPSHL